MKGSVRRTQLFNLNKNPYELLSEHKDLRLGDNSLQINLANNPKFATKLNEMEILLFKEMKRLDDPYRLWDQPK
jgi:hypothetical protein